MTSNVAICPKVGIITIHFGINHGSVLQCYALCRTLEKLGAEVEVIDYVPARYRMWENIKVKYPERPLVWKVAFLLASSVVRVPQKAVFYRYLRKVLDLSKRYDTESKLKTCPPMADLFLVGSDQVWNSAYNGAADGSYLFSFLPDGTMRASYAASIGRDGVTEADADAFRRMLPSFAGVSVREECAVEIIESLGIRCRQDLDPVFLLSRNTWASLASRKGMDEHYVLVYVIAQDYGEMLLQAREIADRMGSKLFVLSARPIRDAGVDRNFIFANPSDFLGLFSRAAFVISNSFHGTAFSIIFHKRFLTYAARYNSRIESILAYTDLESRLIRKRYDEEQLEVPIDWTSVDEAVAHGVRDAEDYLAELLRGCCT